MISVFHKERGIIFQPGKTTYMDKYTFCSFSLHEGIKVSLIVALQRFSFLHTQNYEFLASIKLVSSLTDLFLIAKLSSLQPQILQVYMKQSSISTVGNASQKTRVLTLHQGKELPQLGPIKSCGKPLLSYKLFFSTRKQSHCWKISQFGAYVSCTWLPVLYVTNMHQGLVSSVKVIFSLQILGTFQFSDLPITEVTASYLAISLSFCLLISRSSAAFFRALALLESFSC